jgi:hypothetical protein
MWLTVKFNTGPATKKQKTIGCVSLIVIIVAIAVLLLSPSPAKPPSESLVYAHSQIIVEDYLKAPATAKYPGSDGYTVTKINDYEYTVASYVDSENSFGAIVRSRFVVSISYNEDWTKYKATSVIIDAEKYL